MKIACCAALLAGLLVSPALATVMVSVQPAYQEPWLVWGTTTANIVADIPENEAIVGWGLDLGLVGTSVSIANVDIALPFDAAPTHDGDGLAGLLMPPASVFGNGVVLATITLTLNHLGDTLLVPSYTANDLSEGLALASGGFAQVQFVNGLVHVVPEPASLALLGLVALLRRR